MRFKILTHFIKGKISLSLMEIIVTIPKELKSLNMLVKLAKKKKEWNEGLKKVNLTLITMICCWVWIFSS
jgi:hypothetical protein